MPTVEFSPTHRNKGGRPKGKRSKKHDPSRIICKVLPRIERFQLLAELARGVTVMKTDRKGNTVTYTEPPNEKAIRQLNEYDMGKAVERAEMDIKSDGKPLAVALIPPIVKEKKKRDEG